jgi:hypothetical protein
MQAELVADDWSRFGRRVSGNWPTDDKSQKNIRVRDPVVAMMTIRGISRSAGAESRLVCISQRPCLCGSTTQLEEYHMSVFSPGVENRLSALAASFMVRKADAFEAFSRLTALDLLFVDSAQRNRLLRLQSALTVGVSTKPV